MNSALDLYISGIVVSIIPNQFSSQKPVNHSRSFTEAICDSCREHMG